MISTAQDMVTTCPKCGYNTFGFKINKRLKFYFDRCIKSRGTINGQNNGETQSLSKLKRISERLLLQ